MFLGFSRFVFTDNDNSSSGHSMNMNPMHSVSMNRTEPSDMSGYIIK